MITKSDYVVTVDQLPYRLETAYVTLMGLWDCSKDMHEVQPKRLLPCEILFSRNGGLGARLGMRRLLRCKLMDLAVKLSLFFTGSRGPRSR